MTLHVYEVKHSVLQSHPPHFKCSVASCGQVLWCCTEQILKKSCHHILLIYASVLGQELWQGPFLSDPGVFVGWRGEQHAASKDALKRQKWLTCFPSRGQRQNLLFTDTGLSLGEVKPALWAQEEELCFLVGAECTKLSSPPRLPTPQFTRSLRASLKVTLNTSTLTSCIQSHSKRVQPPGSPWPLMFSPSTESTHSHTWIPATTCLGSEFQTHTPISSSPSTFHLSNSHFRSCFLPPILPWCPHLQVKLQTLLSKFNPVHGPPELTPRPQPQLSPFLPSKWYWYNYTTHTHTRKMGHLTFVCSLISTLLRTLRLNKFLLYSQLKVDTKVDTIISITC